MRKPKSVMPLTVGQALTYMDQAAEELIWATMGFSRIEKNNLLEKIVRLSLAARKPHPHPDLQRELNMLLDDYENKYSWLHASHKGGKSASIQNPRRSKGSRRYLRRG